MNKIAHGVQGGKSQIRAPTKFWIETHHLKGLFNSKISENHNIFDIGSTVLKLMAVEKSGLFLELSFRGHNLC